MEDVNRVLIIVLDGVGIGELPDASKYGDEGSDTLGNLSKAVNGLNVPNLQKLGLGNIRPLVGVEPAENPLANFGRLAEKSPGKDSTTGHWEIAGLNLDFDFPYYPNGFPDRILDKFCKAVGKEGVLGNKAASGTEIIKELGEEHLRTGWPIVYTSADSVFQIAANESVTPTEELYRMCQIARDILTGEDAVARVIARPFVGDSPENFIRTRGRRDFSLKPTGTTMFNRLQEKGIKTVAIGKIDDLYAGDGLDVKVHTKSNAEGVAETIRQLKTVPSGLIMTNLVDFDMLWGHRNNVEGFNKELEAFDKALNDILPLIDKKTVMMITADHGNDPTTPSTDHSREYIPLLVYGAGIKKGIDLGIRRTFADIGQTVTQIFGTEPTPAGIGFWENIH